MKVEVKELQEWKELAWFALGILLGGINGILWF